MTEKPRRKRTRKQTGLRIFKPPAEEFRDLGFGTKVSEESGQRLLNRDGSFNVERSGLSFFQSLHLYHSLLNMSWLRFHLTFFSAFVALNSLFATAFVLCGPNAIQGSVATTFFGRLLDAFFFSVQTFTTVGFGHLTPNGVVPNILVTLNAFLGLMGFALATGLLFARFARPSAHIIFSEKAIIAPYRDMLAFEFRIANARSNQLEEVEVKVLLSQMVGSGQQRRRRFEELPLERSKVAFLPLHLTVVHPIDDRSPLKGKTIEDLKKADAEFLILISAFDETFSQTVHARSSYKYEEIVWQAKFSDMFQYAEDGVVGVDLRRLHALERIGGVSEGKE